MREMIAIANTKEKVIKEILNEVKAVKLETENPESKNKNGSLYHTIPSQLSGAFSMQKVKTMLKTMWQSRN